MSFSRRAARASSEASVPSAGVELEDELDEEDDEDVEDEEEALEL